MSQSIRTAKMNIHPKFYDGKNGRTFQTDIFTPQTISLDISPDGKLPSEQIKAILASSFENGIECEIEFSTAKDNWGKEKFFVYDVKPIPKKLP